MKRIRIIVLLACCAAFAQAESLNQTSLNDLDKAEEASKLRSAELAVFAPVSHPESWIAD